MVEYFGGSTTMWVPDQLKSAITRPCRYEPGVNRTYEDLAVHYGAVVMLLDEGIEAGLVERADSGVRRTRCRRSAAAQSWQPTSTAAAIPARIS